VTRPQLRQYAKPLVTALFTVAESLVTFVSMARELAKRWGVIALLGLVAAWIGGASLSLIVVLSLVSAIYLAFQAPFWCCAVNRDGTLCRKNAHGVLMGCSLRQHKWQKLKMTVVPHSWRTLNRGLWGSPVQGLTTLATLATIVSGITSVVALLVSSS